MCAYNAFRKQPCCASDLLMNDILRKQWQFNGYVTSDCWAIDDFFKYHKTHKNATESARRCSITWNRCGMRRVCLQNTDRCRKAKHHHRKTAGCVARKDCSPSATGSACSIHLRWCRIQQIDESSSRKVKHIRLIR